MLGCILYAIMCCRTRKGHNCQKRMKRHKYRDNKTTKITSSLCLCALCVYEIMCLYIIEAFVYYMHVLSRKQFFIDTYVLETENQEELNSLQYSYNYQLETPVHRVADICFVCHVLIYVLAAYSFSTVLLWLKY